MPRPEEIEGSEARARDRGYFDAEVPDDDSLAAPAVVEGLVRSYFSDALAARTRWLKDEISAEQGLKMVMDGAAEMQRIFYGQTKLYKASEFNAPERLGQFIVANINGGSPEDAVSRLLVANLKQICDAVDAAGRGEVNDDMVQLAADLAIEESCAALLGVPINTFVTMRASAGPPDP